MAKTIFITEKQLGKLNTKPNKKGVVNSGIMDMIARADCCGISENNETTNELSEDCDYEIGFENNSPLEYAHIVNRKNDVTIEEEVYPSDVDLSSFRLKTKLNPKIWKDGHLDSRVRIRLLDIADKFIETLEFGVEPIDIIMTGSLASYTWSSEHSDIDLHILIDFADVGENVEMVKDYCDAKKNLWNQTHGGIEIFGFPVELYVQDAYEKHSANGIYSLEKNEWVKRPHINDLNVDEFNAEYIKKSVADYMNIIDEIQDRLGDYKDKFDIKNIFDDSVKWLDRIKKERKQSLQDSDNILSNGNIIFKTLRRNGYIAKLLTVKRKSFDIYMSLP